MAPPQAIIVLGVSGSGKTTVGRELAEHLGFEFCDADDLHSAANIEKMASGHPLTDDDRLPWLNTVGQHIAETERQSGGIVVACSALKRSYRDILRRYDESAFFVHLDGTFELIASRIAARTHHFMPPSLLSSQFATLEALGADEVGVTINIDEDPPDIVDQILASMPSAEGR
jgi:carbohydrate kinase (thermoresistant glucokinase family)